MSPLSQRSNLDLLDRVNTYNLVLFPLALAIHYNQGKGRKSSHLSGLQQEGYQGDQRYDIICHEVQELLL